MRRFSLATAVALLLGLAQAAGPKPSALPIVINTWAFTNATQQAWATINDPDSLQPALDAVEQGCSTCEQEQCDGTVGFGGSPDEMGETTLDAFIMDGNTLEVGAVGALRHVKNAITTARLVMTRTRHTFLAGLSATQFALDMGQPVGTLTTDASAELHRKWTKHGCQPNFRKDVLPDPTTSCGPYHLPDAPDALLLDAEVPTGSSTSSSRSAAAAATADEAAGSRGRQQQQQQQQAPKGSSGSSSAGLWLQLAGTAEVGAGWPTPRSHDTIAMAAIDAAGNVAAGCSTNGAIHKIPGRIGDGAIPGGGAYADSTVGACGATGDGDVHLRFLPCYQVVENMRRGMKAQAAAEEAVLRIARRVPGYVGAVFAVDKHGNHGAACFGWQFTYAYQDATSDGVQVVVVDPVVVPGKKPDKAGGGGSSIASSSSSSSSSSSDGGQQQ